MRKPWWRLGLLIMAVLATGCGGPVVRPIAHSSTSPGSPTLPTTTIASTPPTTGSSGSAPAPPASAFQSTADPKGPGLGRPYWIIGASAITLLQQAGLSNSLLQYFFDNAETYLVVGNQTSIGDQFPNAVQVDRFTSFADMQSAFSSGSIPAGTKAIMYDNEGWSLTPNNEKQAPIQYAAQAEALVHQHDMQLVFTPAVNLANINSSGGVSKQANGNSKWVNYLNQDLAGRGSAVSDVFDIQAQQAEATSEFLPFSNQSIRQARVGNPHAVVMVGIGTNPSGRSVTAQEIMDAYQSTRAETDGYWLNIPQAGPECPDCGTVQPEVAVSFLQSLATALGQSG